MVCTILMYVYGYITLVQKGSLIVQISMFSQVVSHLLILANIGEERNFASRKQKGYLTNLETYLICFPCTCEFYCVIKQCFVVFPPLLDVPRGLETMFPGLPIFRKYC
jgi:hypothetical protein